VQADIHLWRNGAPCQPGKAHVHLVSSKSTRLYTFNELHVGEKSSEVFPKSTGEKGFRESACCGRSVCLCGAFHGTALAKASARSDWSVNA
ncbi:uncharacterized, partial [Tachysurus ichikawai]